MKLYEIVDTYRRMMDTLEIDPDTGELANPEVLDDLAAQEANFDEKIETIACYIKELRADAKAIKEEETVLKTRRQSTERKAEWLKEYLSNCMTQMGKDKFKTPRCALSFRASQSVRVIDLQLFADCAEFVRVKPPEPNKEAIKAALHAGRQVPGAELVETRSLQIK